MALFYLAVLYFSRYNVAIKCATITPGINFFTQLEKSIQYNTYVDFYITIF